jgi:hypothetical protein
LKELLGDRDNKGLFLPGVRNAGGGKPCGAVTSKGSCGALRKKGADACSFHSDNPPAPFIPVDTPLALVPEEFDLTTIDGVIRLQGSMFWSAAKAEVSPDLYKVLDAGLGRLAAAIKQRDDKSPQGQARAIEAAKAVAGIIAAMSPAKAQNILINQNFITTEAPKPPALTVDAVDVEYVEPENPQVAAYLNAVRRHMPNIKTIEQALAMRNRWKKPELPKPVPEAKKDA